MGCHCVEHVQQPSLETLKQLIEWSDNTIRVITLAAELPDADVVTRYAVSHNITVALGHQVATATDIERLADCGATLLTHLGNGAPSTIHRHHNSMWPSISEQRLTASIITDGHHLPTPFIKTVLRAKGAHGVLLVSDIAAVAGLPPGIHPCMGKQVLVCEDGSVREVDGSRLAGSGSTMLMCLNYLSGLGICSLRELEMLTFYNPLRMIHMSEDVVRKAVQHSLISYHIGGVFTVNS